MLYLLRGIGESVVIGENTYVTVCGFHHDGRIKLAFDAPKETKIWRHELTTTESNLRAKDKESISDEPTLKVLISSTGE